MRHYGKPCDAQKDAWVTVEWYPGHKTRVLAVHASLWRALGAVMVHHQYRVPTSYTGSYSCRPITGRKKGWSGHAWPVALDVNAATNPYIRTRTGRPIRWGKETDMPAHMIADIESITAGGVRAFGWGGRWRTIKDAMHFQIRVTPAEIAAGIKAPYPYDVTAPAVPAAGEEDEMALKAGDKGEAVRRHQAALQAWSAKLLPDHGPDGSYGDETTNGVKAYQEAAGLPATGEIDGITSALLLTRAVMSDHTHTVSPAVMQ